MRELKNVLYDRIKNLRDWQIHMIIGDFLFDADEKQLEAIKREVESYEKINIEIEEEMKKISCANTRKIELNSKFIKSIISRNEEGC